MQAAVLSLLGLPALLTGQSDPDVVRYLREITVEEGRSAADVICIYCSIRVLGTVEGDVVAIGGNVEVAGVVNGDAVACGGRVRLAHDARVEGDVTALGGEIERPATAKITGERESMPYLYVPGQKTLHATGALTVLAGNVLVTLLGALMFRSRRSTNAGLSIRRHPFLTLASGCVLMAAWIFLLSLSAPNLWVRALSWTANLLLLAMMYCGYTALAWTAGGLVVRSRALLRWLCGAAMLGVGLLVPVAGAILFIAIILLSLGAALASGMGRDPDSLAQLVSRRAGTSAAQGASAR